MNKAITMVPLAVLLITSVLALSGMSLRGQNGVLNFVGSDSSFIWSSNKFSAYSTPSNGQASIQIQAKTASGDEIRVSGNYKNQVILVDNSTTLQVFLTSSNTVYWKQGNKPQVGAGNIVYTYNKITQQTTVVGTGLVNFQVSNIPTLLVS